MPHDFYVGRDFSGGTFHGCAIVVMPSGWRVARRGKPIASGPETGAVGLARALEAAGAI